jgi:transposase, IS6 family
MSGDFKWRHFVGEIIILPVRWYCKYCVSYRDREELIEERRVEPNHTTLYSWRFRNRETHALGFDATP